MFHDVLSKLLSRLKGADWAMVVGLDGVLLEASGVPRALSSEAVAAEYALFYRACMRVVAETSGGEIKTFCMDTDQGKVLLQTLTPEYFLLLGLTPDVLVGRARYEIARVRALLEQDLVF